MSSGRLSKRALDIFLLRSAARLKNEIVFVCCVKRYKWMEVSTIESRATGGHNRNNNIN